MEWLPARLGVGILGITPPWCLGAGPLGAYALWLGLGLRPLALIHIAPVRHQDMTILRCIILLLFFCLLSPRGVHSQDPDSLQTAQQPVQVRASWERVVDFPGEIVYAPFGLLFHGAESFLDYQERTRFLQRVRDRFIWDEGSQGADPCH